MYTAADPHLEVIIRRLSGRPGAAGAVEANDADLLVLGSRGLGGLVGFLMRRGGHGAPRSHRNPGSRRMGCG